MKTVEKTERHQARSLMAALATKMGEQKQRTITSLLHLDLAVVSSASDAGEPRFAMQAGVYHVPGVGDITSGRRFVPRKDHKSIYEKIQNSTLTNWQDPRFSNGELVSSEWLPATSGGGPVGLEKYEVAMVSLESLVRSQIKIMMENPQIKENIQWVFADMDEEKINHFVFAICIDGFPLTKHKGATEAILQCLNLVGGINQNDFNRIIALAELDETSPEMDKIAAHIDEEAAALKNKVIEIELVLPVLCGGDLHTKHDKFYSYEKKTVAFTVDFFFKADLKYFAHALGQMPSSATEFGVFMRMTKNIAASFNEDSELQLTTLEERKERYRKVQAEYKAAMADHADEGDKKKSDDKKN